jgi:hypothetical protein
MPRRERPRPLLGEFMPEVTGPTSTPLALRGCRYGPLRPGCGQVEHGAGQAESLDRPSCRRQRRRQAVETRGYDARRRRVEHAVEDWPPGSAALRGRT